MDPGARLLPRPDLLPENRRALDAWLLLHRHRQSGFGESAIALHDIKEWVPEPLRKLVLAAEHGWLHGRAQARKDKPED